MKKKKIQAALYYSGATIATALGTLPGYGLGKISLICDQSSNSREQERNIQTAKEKIATLTQEQALAKSDVTMVVSNGTYETSGPMGNVKTITPIPYAKLFAEQQQIITTNQRPVPYGEIGGGTYAMMLFSAACAMGIHWWHGSSQGYNKGLTDFYENMSTKLKKSFAKKSPQLSR